MDIPRLGEPKDYDQPTMQRPLESSSRTSPLSVQTNPVINANFKAPSMMSMTSIHAGSQISTMSSIVDTDSAELTDQQQQKFENISIALCPTHPEYGNAEADGLDDVAKVNAQNNGELIRLLIEHARTVPFSCYKYALLTLHSLVSDKVHGSQCAQQARQMDTMQVVSEWLQHEKSEKLLPVIVDLVRILCDKNHEQKAYFLGMNGIPKLLNILKKCLYENCLWRTTRLLTMFSNFNPQMLVQCNAPAVLAPQLAHDSERLVLVSLECLRNISDVPTEANRCELLRALLRLFGHRNHKVIRYTLDILANLCANNKVNKECILSILCTLCVGNSMSEEVRIEVFRQPQLFLEKLIHMRPVLLKQTLQLLSKVALRDENLEGFRNCSIDGICFIQQIVYILRVACNQPPETQMVEGIKVNELINISMSVLHCLCRDRELLEMVVYYLLYPENMKVRDCDVLLPVYALHDIHEESVRKTAISLIDATVHHPKMAMFFSQNHNLISGLQHFARSCNPVLAHLAKESLKSIMLGGTMSRNQFPPSYMRTKEKPLPPLEVSTSSTAAPSTISSPTARNMRMASESALWQGPMEGAGEQLPEDFAVADDPFVNVFCPTAAPQSSPPFSPPVNHSMNDNALGVCGDEAMQISSPQSTWDSPHSLQYMEHLGCIAPQMGLSHPSQHMSETDLPSHMTAYPHHQTQPMPYVSQSWHAQMPHLHADVGIYSMHNYYQNQSYPSNPDYQQRYDQYHHQYGRFH
ncbi:unnamed protein product [Strongylus vulgaris]|uniref:Armadillo repeat-containing domain-containing protein n=1 Tax=Strongylus vulgaris TaxID=40348 RepID=A0A3P7IXN4_STRVU|nr:unnamed protein product [Strongylus vulgaris]